MTSPHHPARPAASAHAQRIADAIADAWTQRFRTGTDLHIPLSIAAALALATPKRTHATALARQLADLSPEHLPLALRHIWRAFLTVRPELGVRVAPLISWLSPYPDDDQRDSAHTITHAALRAGLLELTTDDDRRRGTDLLGAVLQTLRSHRSTTNRGEFFTPQDIAEALTRITLSDITTQPAGTAMHDPAAGTGSLLCAAARVLREHGRDPAEFRWYANDLDALTAACLAVNTHLWALGHHVTIGCGDTLTDTWLDRARHDHQLGIHALALARLHALHQTA